MSNNNSPNLATSINNNNTTTSTTTPRTTSIDEITPKTATCTEQLLALAAASHASADMAASSTHEVDEDESSSSVKQLLPITSPIKIANGSSTNDSSNNKEKVPTPDRAASNNSQMSPTTAIKITEAQTPRHCNKSPYNTSTTAAADQPSSTKEGSTNKDNSTTAHPNPQAAQLNTSRYFHKPIKQYWPIRYSTINTNERRIQAELGNYSTTFTEVGENERECRIKERDARDYGISQQRNIYEQQQKYVNAHRNMYEQQQPYGYGGSPTHYHHQALPPHHMVDPRGYDPRSYSASSQKYHYEGSGYPPHYPPSHHPAHPQAQGGYYGSPSNYQHQYNVAGYSAAQVAPHHAPGYNVPTTSYQGSYQDEQVPLSTAPSKEDGSKDGSLHAVSSSFSNEGVGSKALMKSMQSPGVVTRNGSGSVGESTEEGAIPNQPSLKSSYESNYEDDAASWHQTKDEMLRLTMTKSELTDVSKVTDESSGVVQTEKQEAEGVADTSKKEGVGSSAVQTPKNIDTQQSSEEKKKPQDVEESDLKQVPSTLSALSNSPTDEQQQPQQQPPSSTRSSRAATHAIQHYESSMNEMMMMGYHHPPRGNMMYPPPAQHHVPSPHHYGHHPYHHLHTAAYHYPPPQHYHAHPPPHMHPARLSNVHTAQGANPEDDNSPSASTISTKASLAVAQPPVMVSNTPRAAAAGKDGNTGDLMHAHQLLSLSASKSNDDDDVKSTRQQQGKNSAVKTETMAEPQDDEYANSLPPAKRRRKLSDISMNPSPTAMALDNRPSPTDSATNQSQQSHQSLELGAMPSWDTAGAGRPLAGWSVCSGMGSTGGHSFGATDVHNLLGSAFSFSDSVLHSTTGGGEHERPSSSGSSADDQDPSPKSILSKVGEKRKSLAPGTHVQFSTSSSSSHGGRKRGLPSSQQAPPPPPMSHEEYAYYQSRHGYPPSYHSSAGHRGTYPEEDPYYGHPHRAIVSSATAAEYARPQFQQDRRRPESSVPPSSKSKIKIPAPQFINMHGTTMAAPGGGYWTKEEDSTLMDLMKKKSSLKDWGPMTSRLNKACGGNKIPGDVQERWVRYLKPGSRKGQWTKEEDNIVSESVENSNENPYTRWSDLSRELPGRVGKQVRDRWVNHLNPALSHEPFSKEDDLLLWEGHHNIGKRWTVISAKVFKGSRSENHIKNRWYSAAFKKFIAKEFGDDEYKLVNSGQTSANVVAVTGLVSHPKSKQQKPQEQPQEEHFTVIDGQTSKRKRIAYAGEIIDR